MRKIQPRGLMPRMIQRAQANRKTFFSGKPEKPSDEKRKGFGDFAQRIADVPICPPQRFIP